MEAKFRVRIFISSISMLQSARGVWKTLHHPPKKIRENLCRPIAFLFILVYNPSCPADGHKNDENQDEDKGVDCYGEDARIAGLFRWSGYLDYRAVAEGKLEGEKVRRGKAVYRRPAQGVRRRLHLADAQGGRGLRGQVSAGHVLRTAADCQAPRRNRPQGELHCHLPRLHRQGQRPSPLRADHQGV